MDEGTLKTAIPKCSLFCRSFMFGVVKQFCRFWIWSETECKTPAEYGLQHNSTHPPPHSNTLSVYTVHLVWEGGGEVREKVEGQQYTRIVPSSTGATVHKLWMYLNSIKSVKHNAAKSVNRSFLKKSRHLGLGVFIVHSSMRFILCFHLTPFFFFLVVRKNMHRIVVDIMLKRWLVTVLPTTPTPSPYPARLAKR